MPDVAAVPSELVDLAWWAIAYLIVIAIAVSVLLSISKSLLRIVRPSWTGNTPEKIALRILGVCYGAALAVGAASVEPFDALPISIVIAIGVIAGAHSEVVYQWGIKHVESIAKRVMGSPEEPPS